MNIDRYREDLAVRIVDQIAERNGGLLPGKVEEYEAMFDRFGAKVKWMPASVLPEPMVRRAVVYMPDTRPNGRQLLAWLAHELAEVVLRWEGTQEYQGPGWTGDRHRVAKLVEDQLLRGLIVDPSGSTEIGQLPLSKTRSKRAGVRVGSGL